MPDAMSKLDEQDSGLFLFHRIDIYSILHAQSPAQVVPSKTVR